jgi:hypothetical protein
VLDLVPAWRRVAPRLQGIVTLILMLIGLVVSLLAIFAALSSSS